MRIFVLGFLLLFHSMASAAIDFNQLEEKLKTIHRGVQLELNQEGFETFSDMFYERFIKENNQFKLPDQSFSIAPIAHIQVGDIVVKVDWQDAQVRSTNSGLKVLLAMQRLTIEARDLRVSSYLLPFLKTQCQSTTLQLGGGSPLRAEADLGLSVNGEEFRITPQSLSFDLAADQYSSSGPSRCHGLFGIRDFLSQFIFATVLKNAKKLIVNQIHSQFQSKVPMLQQFINNYVNLKIPVDIEDTWIIPETKILLQTFPFRIDTNKERLIVEMGLHIKPYAEMIEHKTDPHLIETFHKIASLGINPDMINELLTEMFKDGGPEFEINKDTHEFLGNFLKTDELVFFWPDLENLELSSNEMIAHLSLTKAPQLQVNVNGVFGLSVPQVQARFQVYQNERWTDYFYLQTDLKATLTAQIADNVLQGSLAGIPENITGHWPATYKPKDPTFNQEGASEIFQNFMTYGLSKINPIHQTIPIFSSSTHQFGLDNLRTNHPYVQLDLVEYVAE